MVASGRIPRAMEPEKESASDGATTTSNGANAEEKASSEKTQMI